MKNTKRFICLTIVIALLLGVMLTGCGDKKEDAAAPNKTDTTANSEPSKNEEPKLQQAELIWYTFVDKKMKDEDIVFEELNKYLKEKINATLKQNIMTYDDYNAKMPVIVASGQPFDICFTAGWINHYLPNVAKGAFAPLNDLLDQYGKDTKDFIPSALWDAVKVQGNIYAIPSYKEVGHQYGYMINNDIAKKYGYDLSQIKKFTDIEPYLKDLREKDKNIIPFSGGGALAAALPVEHLTGDWGLPGVANIPGLESFAGKDDTIFNQYETSEYAVLCDTMYRWWKAGYMPKDNKNFEEDGTSRLNADKAGKLFSWQIWYAPGYDKTYSQQVGHEEVFVPCYDPIFETADVFGGLQAISANSENKERATMFLNLLNTDKKVGTMVRHGIEGKHYAMKGNQLDRTAVDGIDVKNHPYDYVFGWQFGTVFNQIWDVSYPEDIQDVFMKYNNSMKPTAHLGFNFDTKLVQAEVATLQNVLKEFGPLNYGMVDPKVYLPKFLEKLKANGSEKLIEEVRKQAADWKAANGK